MHFKRGPNLANAGFSAPHFSALVNEVDYDITDRLAKFNAWVDMSNALNPAPILQQLHCTWLCFVRSRKEVVLRWCDKEQCWELDALIVAEPKPKPDDDEGGCAAAPDEPDDPPLGGGGTVELILSGGFYLPPEEHQPRRAPLRGRRRRPPPDYLAKRPTAPAPDREPAAAAKRKTKRITKKSPKKRIMLRTRALLRTVRQSPRFRHMQRQFEACIGDMKAVGALSRDTARALAHAGSLWLKRKAARVKSLFMERRESAACPQAFWESGRYEIRPGFTLVLYNFESQRPEWDKWLFGKLEIEVEYPNWGSWLFGKPLEDEQKVA
jgi:hypothetical protein